ncbi:LOW QUALITY PROTEIN: hypothetical protein PanWU01x14_011780 [Parasponia andersonii]|uniref:Uncharacterized protein n=1 Tax=Parasponia andersonii TaxID=3476 RepID=A0A2P5E1N6_PARAD|nr:LOW QUALITY PROTEIN: hypothetical protein PanWU01x14_011780 [Parasponia andersonii]
MLGFFHGQFLKSGVAFIATHQIPDWSLVLSQRKTETAIHKDTAIFSFHLKKRKKKKKKRKTENKMYPSMFLYHHSTKIATQPKFL